jgi:hypothetical protein
MSAKLILDTAAMQEDFFADTSLIGIVSPLPVYRFCWLLNQHLDLDFTRDPEMDVVLQTTPKETHYFPMYQFCMPMHGSQFFIYKLKSGKETLLPEVKQLDYLWMIQSASPEEDAEKMTGALRNIPDIQLAQILSTDRLKNLSHLLV